MIEFTPPTHLDADKLRQSFSNAEPFRFIMIDNFLPKEQFKAAVSAFPGPESPIWLQYRSGAENKKLQSQSLKSIASPLSNILSMLNDEKFIKWIEYITGIPHLMPDPDYHGGGLHQTLKGGHLSIHIDYNRHSTQGWHRRLNAILYLNETWDASWGGSLELWTDNVRKRAHSIQPVGNRLVVFETTERSWHGHPDPLNPPPGISRKSIAAYYYSVDRPQEEIAQEHNTVFCTRPGERFTPTAMDFMSKLKKFIIGR